MVYGELGRYPLSISVKVRKITFWANVINCNTSKLTGILYLLASRNHNINSIRSPWISFIKGILDECGLCDIYSCTQVNVLWLKHTVKRILCDQFLQKWNSKKCNSFYLLFVILLIFHVRGSFSIFYFVGNFCFYYVADLLGICVCGGGGGAVLFISVLSQCFVKCDR